MKKLIAALIFIQVIACHHPSYEKPHVVISTRLRNIELELYPKQAPKTVEAFLNYIRQGVYENSSFYRVLKSEEFPTDFNTGIIQGGIWQTAPEKMKNLPPIILESTDQSRLSHTDGTLSMARPENGSAKTEFFICIGDQSTLDFGKRGTIDGKGFSAFGKVWKGMEIARKIQSQKNRGDRFIEKIEIAGMTIR